MLNEIINVDLHIHSIFSEYKDGKIVEQGELQGLLKKESLFVKNNIELPFMSDLSNKIMSYELIDRPIYEMDEMVDEIWQ